MINILNLKKNSSIRSSYLDSIIFLAPLKLIELLSLNKINFGLKVFKPVREKRPLDLSFRDMLTWYIEGQYKLGTQIKYELRK